MLWERRGNRLDLVIDVGEIQHKQTQSLEKVEKGQQTKRMAGEVTAPIL